MNGCGLPKLSPSCLGTDDVVILDWTKSVASHLGSNNGTLDALFLTMLPCPSHPPLHLGSHDGGMAERVLAKAFPSYFGAKDEIMVGCGPLKSSSSHLVADDVDTKCDVLGIALMDQLKV